MLFRSQRKWYETMQPSDVIHNDAENTTAFGLLGRRDVLRVGSLTLSASLLPGLMPHAEAARSQEPTGKAKSVIFLWMGGGVTHIDSFDPKPEAPEEIRGELTAINTRLPGVQFSETLPRLAQIADDLAVVRSAGRRLGKEWSIAWSPRA